jgi:antitoxin PrlF
MVRSNGQGKGQTMFKAKVTSKGQITIPQEVRDALGVKPGEKVAFLPGLEGEFRLRRVGSIDELYGCLAGYGGDAPKTNRELNELMASYAVERDEAAKSGAQKQSDGEAA